MNTELTDKQMLDKLSDKKIDVLHKIEFKSTIDMEDYKIIQNIMDILIENGYTDLKHTIYFDKNQSHLMKDNTKFKNYCIRIRRYMKKLQLYY